MEIFFYKSNKCTLLVVADFMATVGLFSNVLWHSFLIECCETLETIFGANELTVAVFLNAVSSP